jgi:hypothetical protein
MHTMHTSVTDRDPLARWRCPRTIAVFLWLVPACGTANAPAEATEEVQTPLTHRFSFAVFADPHVTGETEHLDRLNGAVAWVNDAVAKDKIELVVVVGDIGWGGGLPFAKDALDQLSVPYVPILGDNEVHLGAEERFDEVFGAHLDDLDAADVFRGQVAGHHPEHDKSVWMQNVQFTHRDVHFVGLDWNSRSDNSILGELGELNDFDGGSLPFFDDAFAGLPPGIPGDVMLFSHHPMHVLAFSIAQIDRIGQTTLPAADRIAGAWAGHYHINHEESVLAAGYDVFVTDAVWDDENTIRVVEVHSDGAHIEVKQRLETVAPWQ